MEGESPHPHQVLPEEKLRWTAKASSHPKPLLLHHPAQEHLEKHAFRLAQPRAGGPGPACSTPAPPSNLMAGLDPGLWQGGEVLAGPGVLAVHPCQPIQAPHPGI